MDLEEQEKIDAEKKKRREEADEDLKWIASTPQGRRFLWQFFSQARIFATSYDSSETTRTFYNEGRKDLGYLYFWNLMRLAPEKFVLMQSENARG